jgi:ferric-dicitrate binding protein FerR (iron transport regulator)
MDQERIFALWANYLAGEATPEELEELEWALRANPDLRRMAELLSGMRQASPKGMSAEEEQQMLERGLQRLMKPPIRSLPVIKRISADGPAAEVSSGAATPMGAGASMGGAPGGADVLMEAVMPRGADMPGGVGSGRRVRLFLRVAAAAIVVLIIGAVFYSRTGASSSTAPTVPTVIAAARGSKKFMQLADGSKLWLNADSRIVFSPGFAAGNREMTLEGEAFFDVKHDERHPFIIHTGRLDVRVLGTTLNVRAYPGDCTVETTLINGKVEIDVPGNAQSSIILHPNEKAIIPVGGAAFRRPIEPDRTDGTITETSWVSNKLVFRQETLAGMATRLERWYDVKIIFDNERFRNDTLSGTFPEEPIGDVMHALQITAGFHYRIDKDTVRIW